MGSVLLLSAAGIYAMMSFTVARRRREIGIRTALGATSTRVLAGIFGRASAQLGAGVLAGLALTPATGIVGEEARRQFVGEYQLGPGAVFRVDFEEGAFVLTTPGGGTIPMVHESGAT